ncbi:hypothetical protein ACS0TY_010009 [Phlomoides rotata]
MPSILLMLSPRLLGQRRSLRLAIGVGFFRCSLLKGLKIGRGLFITNLGILTTTYFLFIHLLGLNSRPWLQSIYRYFGFGLMISP